MGGSSIIPTFQFSIAAQTCDPSSPCLYTGEAKTVGGVAINIVVKFDSNNNYVADVEGKGTYYVIVSQTEEDKSHGGYYVNVKGLKYYFSM